MASGTEPFYMDPSFWVAGSTTVFVIAVAAKGAFKKIGEMLDKKSLEIAASLEEARTLRDEAEALLAEYRKKQRDGEKDAAEMVAQAEEDARLLLEAASREIDEMAERRRRLADEKIRQAEASAIKEIRAKAVDIAIESARQVLASEVKGDLSDKLADSAIADVEKRLH